jgi:hypothetical protein
MCSLSDTFSPPIFYILSSLVWPLSTSGLEKKWLRGEMESEEDGQGQGNETVNRKELDVAYQKGQDDMQAKMEKELATKRARERDAERKATLDQEETLANKVSSKLEELNKKYYRAPIKPIECVDLRDAVQKCYEAAGSDPLVCKEVVDAFNGCSSKAVAKLISN